MVSRQICSTRLRFRVNPTLQRLCGPHQLTDHNLDRPTQPHQSASRFLFRPALSRSSRAQEQLWSERRLRLLSPVGRVPDRQWKDNHSAAAIVCCMTRRSTTFTSTCRLRRRKCSCSPLAEPPPTASLCPQFRMALNVRSRIAASWRKASSIRGQFADTSMSPNFGPDKVHSWSLGVERETSKNSAVEIRYAGNHALDLFQSVNANPFVTDLLADFPNLVPAGITPCPSSQAVVATAVGRVNCNRVSAQPH